MDIVNGYLRVTGTSIFYTHMLMGQVRYHSIRTRGYQYPLNSNLNKKNKNKLLKH